MLRFLNPSRSASSLYAALAALLLCLLAPARPASALIVSTNQTISALNSPINDNVYVVTSPTGSPTVNLVDGGTITGFLFVQDTSTLNVSGGNIEGFVETFDTSTVNLSGGTIGGNLLVQNSSTLNVSGGTIGGTLAAYDASTVNVSGGNIGGALFAYHTSTVNVSGGNITRSLFAYHTSTLNVSGGNIQSNLGAYDTSTVNLSGGTIAGDLGVIGPNARLNVFGTGLSLTNGVLSGTLADGTPISERVYLLDGAQLSQITLIEVDPFDVLREDVEALGTSGVLNAGNANALLVKLDAAQTALAAGDTAGARDALTGFVNKVNALVRTGKLSAEQGAPLLEAARALLGGIG